MKKYKFIDSIKSDVLFEAYGSNLNELFENAAEAMFSVICKLDKVKPKKEKTVSAKAKNLEELMIAWLQKLIALVDTEAMFFSKFKVTQVSETALKAKIYGEPIMPEKGETVVKAVTYHAFKLEKKGKNYKVRVSLDI